MKTLAIVLATFVLGCGDAPSQQKETSTAGSGSINLPDNGTEYANPCDVPSFQKIVVDGRVVVVETPTLCNQNLGPDKGDPCPDCGDPSPEGTMRSNPDPEQVKPTVIRVMGERQGNAR